MNFDDLSVRAKEIQDKYRLLNQRDGHEVWGVAEYTQGLVGDVGDLIKLIMAKNNFRAGVDVDDKIAHELSDCLWAILVIARELEIDLEAEFMKTMDELSAGIGL